MIHFIEGFVAFAVLFVVAAAVCTLRNERFKETVERKERMKRSGERCLIDEHFERNPDSPATYIRCYCPRHISTT
jgi:hypothetical protein